tara:strand:+ start:531 stop:1016 length:486 start_codon:yes stop_codon:yes gene_type:complete
MSFKIDKFAFIGIDPGVSGGVCVIEGLGYTVCKCPDTIADMAEVLRPYKERKDAMVAIESVHSMPGQGVASTFKFGKNFGEWLGILATLKIPYCLVTPHKWMKFYGSYPKERTLRKTHFKNLAQQRVPLLKVTLATADAILIANQLKELRNSGENMGKIQR